MRIRFVRFRKVSIVELKIWTVDAFAGKAFEGNPAAIMPLDTWLPDTLMQQIAAENNLSETAFLVAEPERGPEHYHLRWFTPEVEVPLCGHATLGSAFVLFTHVHPEADLLVFRTLSGDLRVARRPDGLLAMELPAFVATPHPKGPDIARALGSALRRTPQEVFSANYPVAVFGSEADVAALQPGAELAAVLAEFGESGLTATARASRDGELSALDPSLAAAQFLGLVIGADHLSALMGLVVPEDERRRRVRVSAAVGAFMKIYAPA